MAELKTRILIVDDDQRHRDLLVKYLGNEGYEVKAVPDAAAMDKQLARDRYDLVVLDLMLPGEDGLSICRRLRADDKSNRSSAPAIALYLRCSVRRIISVGWAVITSSIRSPSTASRSRAGDAAARRGRMSSSE